MDALLLKKLPTLYTKRLILRQIKRLDIRDIFEYASDERTSEFLLWYPHYTINDTKRLVRSVLKKYKRKSLYDYAIVLRDTGKMIGTCGFTRAYVLDDKAEIGYVLNPSYQGYGYATEAVERIVSFGFEELGLERIEARFILGNESSERLMRRLGMTFEGVHRNGVKAKGNYRDIGVCSILSSEYYRNISKIK